MSLTIIPDAAYELIKEIRGGTIKRTINAVFPDLDSLNAHHAWMDSATPDEIAKWTGEMITLYNMISSDPVDPKY